MIRFPVKVYNELFGCSHCISPAHIKNIVEALVGYKKKLKHITGGIIFNNQLRYEKVASLEVSKKVKDPRLENVPQCG